MRLRKLNDKYKLVALVCLAMLLLSMIPQLHLWLLRGRAWNGAYVVIQGDEPMYAAYLNALIEGRARRNDPYGAKDHSAATPLPESTFSIQFIPAYVIAFFARLFGLTASSAMIVLLAVAGVLSALAVFWLLESVTVDRRLAAAGTLLVLCLGGLAGGHALVGLLVKTTDLSMPSLPFLRRYQPAASFPLFIVFIGLVWRALTSEIRRASRWAAVLAGVTLAVLIFSYLYLWTAAAAWLLTFGFLWLAFRFNEKRKSLMALAVIGAIAAVALLPYLYLAAHRPPTLDEWQTVHLTHWPDLFRIPELLGVLVLLILVIAVKRRKITLADPHVILSASMALLPLVVFNQQILTGRTIQPYHYAAFVVNYTVLIGLVLAMALWWKQVPRRVLVLTAALSFAWGLVEVGLPSRLNTVPAAVQEDQMVPAFLRLRQLSLEDGTLASIGSTGSASTVVFSPQITFTFLMPTWTSQAALPDAGGIDFGHISPAERKDYFYLHLYYAKADLGALREALKGNPSDPAMKYYARSALFGHHRIVPALAGDFKPIQDDEVETEVRAYQAYADSFSREQALKRPLTYVVTRAESNFDFSNIDRWYDRDSGERVGAYALYRVKLKN